MIGRIGFSALFLSRTFAFTSSQTSCDPLLPGDEQCTPEFSLHPDPSSCALFWECNSGCATLISCPDGYLYDELHGWCDEAGLVECGDRPNPFTTITPGTTEDCGHFLDCSSLYPGWYPDPYNCRKYWNCDENLGGFHYLCEEDYLYDPENHWCDFPERVDCGNRLICNDCDEECETQQHNTSTSVPETTTTTQDIDHCTQFCVTDWGDYQLGCCNNIFCKCEAGVGFYYPCPSGLVYVQQTDQCDYPTNVPCCNS